MNVQVFFVIWQDIGLFLYSILKAFLPLPSLEVVLVPLVLNSPEKWFWYSLIGAVGTCVGGAIGYGIAYFLGKNVLKGLAKNDDVQKGEVLLKRYGLWAIFIGGITPIPDFLLAYLAGFAKMRLLPFLLSDGIARFIRSLLVSLSLKYLGTIINIDAFGTWLCVIVMVFFIIRWGLRRRKMKHT